MPDTATVIEVAASLVDNGQQVSDEYRRGVVELAAQLCLHADNPLYHDDAITVMGYAVCGVNRSSPQPVNPPDSYYCGRGPCCLPGGHEGANVTPDRDEANRPFRED